MCDTLIHMMVDIYAMGLWISFTNSEVMPRTNTYGERTDARTNGLTYVRTDARTDTAITAIVSSWQQVQSIMNVARLRITFCVWWTIRAVQSGWLWFEYLSRIGIVLIFITYFAIHVCLTICFNTKLIWRCTL